MAQSTQVTKKTYNDVINKVIHNCRDAFLDEGMDEHTLQDLKKLWVEKLNASKALVDRRPPQTQPRYVYQNASGQTFTQVRPQMVHSSQPQQVQRRQQAVYLQQSSNQQGRPVQIVQNRQIQPQVGQQQVVTSQRVQIIRPGSQQQTQYVVRLTPQQQQRQQIVQQQGRILQTRTVQQQRSQQHHQYHQDRNLDNNQYDGPVEVSSDDLSSSDSDASDDDPTAVDEPPLDDNDDCTEDEPEESFETDNVIICQYERVTRQKNKWKIHLKDGIMNLDGKEYVFSTAAGDTDW